MPVEIEFDPAKNATNLRVHGISLARAEALLQGFIFGWEDKRRHYGETRVIAIGEIEAREFVCVYTLRGETRRVISLRRANRKERDVYQKAKAAAAGGDGA
jgi:uncharacterized DUF497 family protein